MFKKLFLLSNVIILFFLSSNVFGKNKDYRWWYGESGWLPNSNILLEIDRYAEDKQRLFNTQDDKLWAINSAYNRFIDLANWQGEFIVALLDCNEIHLNDTTTNYFALEKINCLGRKGLNLQDKYENKLTSEVLKTTQDRFRDLSQNAKFFGNFIDNGYFTNQEYKKRFKRYIREEQEILKIYFEKQVYLMMNSLDTIYFEIAENKNKENTPKKIPTKESSGTGFFINEIGHIVTNYHVIEGCKKIILDEDILKVVAEDQINDLAILKGTNKNKKYLLFEKDLPKKGEEILVIGYPFGKDFGNDSKLTMGIISALQGMGNDYTRFQIDAAIQPGNSGGPILNKRGNVIGVAVSSANIQAFLEQYGTIPQNMNFAIQSTTLMMMLISNNIKYKSSVQKEILSNSFIAKEADKAVVYLQCIY